MPSPATLILAALLPAALAALVLVVWRVRATLAPALAVATAYLLGHWNVRGLPPFPPLDVTDWPFHLAPAALAGAAVEAAWPRPAVRWSVRPLLAGGTVLLLLRPLIARADSQVAAASLALGPLAAILILWPALAAVAVRTTPAGSWLVLAAASGAAAVALALSGSLVLGQLGGALAAATASAGLVVWLGLAGQRSVGATAPFVVLGGGLLIVGCYYADLPGPAALLLGAAPLAALALPPGWVRERPRVRALLEAAIVLLPVGLALALAWRASPPYDV